jgi:hypothetical protein
MSTPESTPTHLLYQWQPCQSPPEPNARVDFILQSETLDFASGLSLLALSLYFEMLWNQLRHWHYVFQKWRQKKLNHQEPQVIQISCHSPLQESLMSLAGAVLFILVGLVTLSAYSHPGKENFCNQFKILFFIL